jgi:hypothetical protein
MWLHLLVPREKLHKMNLSNRLDVPSKNHDTKHKEGLMIISVAQNSQTKGLGATADATDSTTVRANASLPADLMTRPDSTNNAAPPPPRPLESVPPTSLNWFRCRKPCFLGGVIESEQVEMCMRR